MKYILLGLAVLIFAFVAFVPVDVSGQVLYPATAYPAFTAVPIYEAYPAYATDLPTFIPSPPPDFWSVFCDALRIKRAYLYVVTPTPEVEEQVEPIPAVHRTKSYLQAPNIRIGQRRPIVATWKVE